ncbi:hypothetical protein FRX31_021867 [Thalictrum thalictroides]|uniref:Uncharacterized protein n=1 Tax=Thalictrum thalictroides TaxID=46969 RepID=A0A7J6VTY3_THATH|nr:hypothetical protein FRX31_021867 [Thalictrum thalictroides]
MENKVVAAFVLCMVLFATTNLHEAAAEDHASCFQRCKDACLISPDHYDESFCDLRCDNFCADNVNLANDDAE